MRTIRDVEIKNKRVFLRTDYNVPFDKGSILDNSRIRASIPTIEHLIEHQNKIIIGTHLGRPIGKRSESSSTVPLAQELARLLKRRVYATELLYGHEVEKTIAQMKPGEILMLGNLRWNLGEERNDSHFAKALAALTEVYVNDAFAVSHRAAASIVKIAECLPSYAGLLLVKEVNNLGPLLEQPGKPVVLIIGGLKVKDKAGVIKNLAPKVDKILLGGVVANTFLCAQGQNIGDSIYDHEMVSACKVMLKHYRSQLVLPIDAVRSHKPRGGFMIYDIGPKTQALFASEIEKAKTIFWNGNLGYTEDKRYRAGTAAVADAVSENKGTKIVAGGDTVGFINDHGLGENFTFLSTGGGASLEFLAGGEMPGLKVLS